jgi:hypothetical protein
MTVTTVERPCREEDGLLAEPVGERLGEEDADDLDHVAGHEEEAEGHGG